MTLFDEVKPEHRSFEYSVTSRASRAKCWAVFLDWQNWNCFANVYGDLRWSGEPWAVGSRSQIELLRPVKARIDHVITVFEPQREIGWLDHGLAITVEQSVVFKPFEAGGTLIRTFGNFVGAPSDLIVEGEPVEDLIKHFIQAWYTGFAAACDKVR
jgi:hypothetical protein